MMQQESARTKEQGVSRLVWARSCRFVSWSELVSGGWLISLRFTDWLAPEDLSADSVNLRLPFLDGSVPLAPGVLPGHVGSPRHLLLSLGLGDLPDVGLVILRPLAVGQLFASPVENPRVRLYLGLLGLRPPSCWAAPDQAGTRPWCGGRLEGFSLTGPHTCQVGHVLQPRRQG